MIRQTLKAMGFSSVISPCINPVIHTYPSLTVLRNHLYLQEARDEDSDNSVAASVDAAGSEHSIHETTPGEELEAENGNKTDSDEGYEIPNPREAEQARLRAETPSEYANLQ